MDLSHLNTIQTWEWTYGPTPEFTYKISHSFSWGDVVSFSRPARAHNQSSKWLCSQTAEIRSKHGTILECVIQLENSCGDGVSPDFLTTLGQSLEGQRYGLVDHAGEWGPQKDVKAWLRAAMS